MSRRSLWAVLLAASTQACALLLASRHPLWPQTATMACALCSVATLWRPRLWLWLLPCGMVFLNAAPWSGWTLCNEFDLVLLSSVAGAYARRAAGPLSRSEPPLPRRMRCVLGVMGAMTLLGLLRAGLDLHSSASPLVPDLFGDATTAQNSLRLAKAELYALLLLPLLPREAQVPPALPSRKLVAATPSLAAGMLAGLVLMVLAVLWERLAFVGLLDFRTPYRAVALFWEMHVGGEAIDAYLALALPFAAWAVLAARRPGHWVAAALLALLALYAALTTFSRGVYAALLASLLCLGLLRLRQGPGLLGWRRHAAQALALALLAEAALVLGQGSFMLQRLHDSGSDWHSRVQHWRRGLSTLHSPADWLLGIGLGRLPAHYAALGPAGEWSGSLAWHDNRAAAAADSTAPAPTAFVRLSGPATRSALAGQFALAQRAPPWHGGATRLRLTLRVQHPTWLQVQWCERHLLYDGRCQSGWLRLHAQGGHWQTQWLGLQTDARTRAGADPVRALPRLSLLGISVLTAGAAVDIAAIDWQLPDGSAALQNADFAHGLAHWQGMAQSYFLPWHIDNLALELLVERGLLGLLLFAALMLAALWCLVWGAARQRALAPCHAAALLGALVVGLSGSLLDVPRVSWLLYLLALDALLPRAGESVRLCEKSTAR